MKKIAIISMHAFSRIEAISHPGVLYSASLRPVHEYNGDNDLNDERRKRGAVKGRKGTKRQKVASSSCFMNM